MVKNKVTADELIQKIEEYRLNRPDEKLSAASLGRYLRDEGYDIKDYTIRRREGVMEYIESCNATDIETHVKKVAVFRALDIDAFLSKNKTQNKLRKALAERDIYYAEQSSAASAAFRENRNLHQQVRDLQKKNEELTEQLKKQETKSNKETLKEKNETIRKLKAIIDEYISEQMANRILEDEGILEVVSSISDKVYEEHLVSADTDINLFRNKSVSKLMEGLEDG